MCEFGTCQDCLRSVEVLKGLPGLDGVNGISVLTGSGDPGVTQVLSLRFTWTPLLRSTCFSTVPGRGNFSDSFRGLMGMVCS